MFNLGFLLIQMLSESARYFVGDFLKENGVYEDIVEFQTLKMFMEEKLEDFNMEPGIISMDLVLFRDAIEHGNEMLKK